MPRVLVVDDDLNLREIVSQILQSLKCDVIEAANGVEGESLALQFKPDLLLLDIMMPQQDGYVTCQHLREKGYTGTIVTMSALQESTGTTKSMNVGANGYLLKPVSRVNMKLYLEYAMLPEKPKTVQQWLEQVQK